MVDIPLIVNADTSSVVKGKTDLTGFKEALGGVKTATDGLTGASQRGTGAQKTYTESQRQGSKAANEATRAAREQASAVDRLSQAYRVAKLAIAGVVGAAIIRDLQNTTMSLQKINMTFTAVTGSASEAAKEMDYVRATADRLGQDVLTAAGAYAKLLAATKGTNITLQESRTVFEGITAAATAYGLSQYELEGALMAVQQMISKGSVQAEELRGQLGERLPGAFQIAARAMGMSTQELSKALELGQVAADDFVRAFGAQLNAEFGAFASQTYTTATAINELENAMLALKEVVISGGFQKAFFTVLEALNRLAQSEGAKAAAEALGAAFRLLADVLAYLLGIIEKVANNDTLVWFLELVTDNIGLALAGATAFAVYIGGPFSVAFFAIARLASAAAGSIAGFIVALGPIGIAVTVVAALAIAFSTLGDSVKDLDTAQKDAQRSTREVAEEFEKLQGLNTKLIDQHRQLGIAAAEGSAAQQAASRLAINATLEEIKVSNDLLEQKRQLMMADQADLKASITEGEDRVGAAARASLLDGAVGYEEIAKIQRMSEEEAIRVAKERIAQQQHLNETISESQRIFLEQNLSLAEARQTYIDNGNAIAQMGDQIERVKKEQADLVAEAKQLAGIKESFAGALGALDDMVWSMGLVAGDAQAMQAALDAAFAAETPQQMADEVRKVQEILARTGNAGGELDGVLDAVLSTLAQMAGVDVASPLWAGAAAAGSMADSLAAAAKNYSALRARTGQSGPDAARSQVQFGQVTLDGEVLTPGVFGAGAPAPVTGSSGGGAGGGGGGATRDAYAEQQADLAERLAKAEAERAAVLGGEDMERYAAVQQAINAATAEGTDLTEAQIDAITQQAGAVFELEKSVKGLKDAFDAIEAAAESFGSAVGKALGDAVFGVGNFRDAATAAFKDLVTTILEELGKLAASKILQMILGGGGFNLNLGALNIPGFAGGGMHAGGLRVVGENGPELEATGAARYWSNADLKGAVGGGGAKVTVNVTNNAGAAIETRTSEDGRTIDIIVERAAERVASQIARGGNPTASAIERSYGLTRRGR